MGEVEVIVLYPNDDCGIGCVPEDVENRDCESGNRNCPTGTVTRVCQYNGAWGNWGNCMVDVEECIDCAGEGQGTFCKGRKGQDRYNDSLAVF